VKFIDPSNGTSVGLYTYNGNIGIGTTRPVDLLEVRGGTVRSGNAGNTTNIPGLKIRQRPAAGGQTGSNYIECGEFADIGNDGSGTDGNRFIVKNDGNVGIGTTSPTAGLHIKGTAQYYNALRLQTSQWQGTGKNFKIQDDGLMFINEVTTGNGVWLAYNATSWTGYSDERVKKNIIEMKDCLNKISNVRPVFYNFKSDDENIMRRVGFIAQDWQEHYPEVINTQKHEGYDFDVLGITYTETIPILLGAIKELKARVEALENA